MGRVTPSSFVLTGIFSISYTRLSLFPAYKQTVSSKIISEGARRAPEW